MPLRLRVTLFLAIATAVMMSAAVALATPTFTICYIAREGKTEPALTAMFAVDYYRAQYPSNTWRFRFVVNLDPAVGALTTRQLLLGWLQNGTGCDAVIGPGNSVYCVAIGPVVSIPWLDYSAQSPQLSDKDQFPTFGRTVPTTDIGPRQTAILVHSLYGWKYANVICINDPYGTAAAQSFTKALYEFGGGAITNSLGVAATMTAVNALLDLIETSRYSRIIYIASSVGYVTYSNLIAAMIARDTGKKFVVIFASSACSGPSAWSTVPGALCSGYVLNETTLAPYTAAYETRDNAPGVAALIQQGFKSSSISPLSVTSSAGFSVDAVHLMMAAQHKYTALNLSSTGVPLYEFMRNVTVPGLTGLVELDQNSDRTIAAGALYNIFPGTNGTTKLSQIAAIDGAGIATFTSTTAYLLGGTFMNGASTIQDTYPVSSSDSQATTIALAVALPVAAVLATIAIIVTRGSGGRNVTNAPKSGQITLLFTDIQSSTKLWSSCPASMSLAIELHHDLIRKVIARHGGYEVKTVGDSFMIACKTATMGAKIAHDIQLELQTTRFPAAIAEVYTASEEDFIDVDDNPDRLAELDPVWNGVRVRIGCHTGDPAVVFDDITRGYDYYGPPVNQAARVESVARGGEICASREFLDASKELGTLMGHVILKGIPDPVPIYDVASGIAGRSFEPFDQDGKSGHDSKFGQQEPSFSDTESLASGIFTTGQGGNESDPLEMRISKLPVVSKNNVTVRTAVEQIRLVTFALVEQFKVLKPKEREALEAKLFAAWHIKKSKSAAGGTQAYEELALRTYTRAHRAAALLAATTNDESSVSTRQNPYQTDDGSAVDGMRLHSPVPNNLGGSPRR